MFKQQGFTLVEVMVAFMVMAIGLLGVIGLQSTAIRNNFHSSAQMQAVLLTKEMADLVRANPLAMTNLSYNNVVGANISACASASGCNGDEMAQYDKYLWDRRIIENLGADAEGVVCIDSTPNDGESAASPACDNTGRLWVVKLWWVDGQAEADLETFSQGVSTADLLYRDTTEGPSYFASFQP